MHILMPLISCVVNEQEFEEAVKTFSDIYVVTGMGKILRHIKLKEGRHIRIEVKEIPGLKPEEIQPQIREEINFLPNGKIPSHLLDEIVQFFKEVMNIKKAEQEAMAHVLWNKKDKEDENKGYRIAIPNQIVSKASVRYEHDHIEKGDIIVLDIHSHNTMNAFFSGTDDSDDKKGIFFSGVAGNLNHREPDFKWRLNINETKIQADVDDIFDIQKVEIKVPTDWLDKVKTNDYSSSGGGYRSPGYENLHPGVYQQGKSQPPAWESRARNNGNNSTNNESWRKNGSESSRSGGHSTPSANDAPAEYGYGYEYGEYNWAGGVASLYPSNENAEDHFSSPSSPSSNPEEKKTDFRPSSKVITLPAPVLIEPGTMSKSEINSTNKKARRIAVDEVDSLPLTIGHYDANVVTYGKDAADAYDQITAWIGDLSGADEMLLDVMSLSYQMLSIGGQEKLAKSGFNN